MFCIQFILTVQFNYSLSIYEYQIFQKGTDKHVIVGMLASACGVTWDVAETVMLQY